MASWTDAAHAAAVIADRPLLALLLLLLLLLLMLLGLVLVLWLLLLLLLMLLGLLALLGFLLLKLLDVGVFSTSPTASGAYSLHTQKNMTHLDMQTHLGREVNPERERERERELGKRGDR